MLVLAEWPRVPPQQLRFGSEVAQPVPQRRLIREVSLTFAKVHTADKD